MLEHKVKLPQFVVDSELAAVFHAELPNCLASDARGQHVVFDWSDVCFFDDYSLLKLVFLQGYLRSNGGRVHNRGFRLTQSHEHRRAVLRQLWAVGLPELIASGHLVSNEQLKDTLSDEVEFLESDPICGMQELPTVTAVVPMLCCHERKYFSTGSREEKQLDVFLRTCLRPPGATSRAWDLIESREFRHLMLQQLRRNVEEHSRTAGRGAIGLAIVRVWTNQSLSNEWGLSADLVSKLLMLWKREPVPSQLRQLGSERGLLQISVMDTGPGIPRTLGGAHDALVMPTRHEDLFEPTKRIHYRNLELDKRFEDPAVWTDAKARVIAFSMDWLGTSKFDRPPEVKGLEYLRQDAVIKMSGSLIIESDGAAVGHITRNRPYGEPLQRHLQWCQSGGTGVCLAVPMTPVEGSADPRNSLHHVPKFGGIAEAGAKTERLIVRDLLVSRPMIGKCVEPTRADCATCAKEIVNRIQLTDYEDSLAVLRRKGLLVIDWGVLPDSKNLFHFLFVEIAQKLATIDVRLMRPFIFANLPMGLCGLLSKALHTYSGSVPPTVICAFAAEQCEPFWLGLNCEPLVPESLRRHLKSGPRRMLTDRRENCTEAFHRECLLALVTGAKRAQPANIISAVVQHAGRQGILQSKASSRLHLLLSRCALFREEVQSAIDSNPAYTGFFDPVFSLREIAGAVTQLFLNEFHAVFTAPPVCFTPRGKKDGIRLPHSRRVVARYFRSDALVDSSIATELTQELTAIALGFAKQMPGERIDWVVSCTSPLHWFVHKLVDGLAECGMNCSHHVFSSYEAISSSLGDLNMRSGENVLVLTDVLASGQTAYRIADCLVSRFKVRLAGLIALADTRTVEDRKNGPRLDQMFGTAIVCLYSEPEPHRADLDPNYYVHPETVVPKRVTVSSATDEFFEKNYSGVGPLVTNHAYFCSPKRTLDMITALRAAHFGHFQHGNHHSEVFVAVESILACREYRNLMVTALFRYIIANDIRLIIYPSHSSAYLLADDLKQRCNTGDPTVQFIMACRTFRGARGTSYALTRFSPHSDSEWRKYSGSGVLILDDAVCSGATVESIIAELARIDRNYYDSAPSPLSQPYESKLSVHVVAFLNRLPRVTGDFWGGLSRVTAGRVQFSAFISMPLAADSADLCPQCRLEKKLGHARDSAKFSLYAKEFLSWWISSNVVLSSHERRHFSAIQGGRFSAAEVLRLAGYLSAIERNGYDTVSERLFDSDGVPAKELSTAVRVHVRSRAGFLHDLLPTAVDRITALCRELDSLLVMSLAANGASNSQNDVLEILQVLTLRYLLTQPSPDETERIMDCLFTRLSPVFDNRLVVGGIASVLDSCLKWFAPPTCTEREWVDVRIRIRGRLRNLPKESLPQRANLMIDWFDTYLAVGGKSINSVGEAVTMLAEFAKKGRRNHFYGRHDLDELRETFAKSASERGADGAVETVRRVLVSTDRFLELVSATRVVQSASPMDAERLANLQNETECDVQQLRSLCNNLVRGETAQAALDDYTTVGSTFLRAYERWFPREQDQMSSAALVIQHFTPNLRDSVISAWESFTPHRLAKEAIQMDMSDLSAHKSLKVLVDPSVLTTAMHQVLDNIDRLSCLDGADEVRCEVRLVTGEVNGVLSPSPIVSGQVEVLVSNSGTPRPELSQVKPRGLSAAKMRLSEYGGGLEYTVPTSGWSFQVGMRLVVWTEEEP